MILGPFFSKVQLCILDQGHLKKYIWIILDKFFRLKTLDGATRGIVVRIVSHK